MLELVFACALRTVCQDYVRFGGQRGLQTTNTRTQDCPSQPYYDDGYGVVDDYDVEDVDNDNDDDGAYDDGNGE